MTLNRRQFAQLAAAAPLAAAAKPNSKINGVQIGVITYSFRELPVEQTLDYITECGFSAIEMMSNVAESYAGVPSPPRGMFGGGPRRPPTPEQRAEMAKLGEEVKKYRLGLSMDKYKALRKMYNDAGIQIYAFKLPPTMNMSDDEYEYIWNSAEALGANHITMELPTDDALLTRVANHAARRKLNIAFHTHGQGGDNEFDKVLAASKYTALNFDVGHFWAVNGKSPVPVMVKYNDRIASLHLKDRKGPAFSADNGGRPGGPNMPWGEGDTPLADVLQTMRKNKYKFPASVEYEYRTPDGSNVKAEVKKCLDYCRRLLA